MNNVHAHEKMVYRNCILLFSFYAVFSPVSLQTIITQLSHYNSINAFLFLFKIIKGNNK